MTALAPLELATGLVAGPGSPVALPAGGRDPLAALEAAVMPALRRSPCLVSFSGGRDSSAILAAATLAARRHGLPEPIPATIRAPLARQSEESRWQELMVAHLGLRDWMRIEVDGELEAVGPVARAVLRRHGLLWPFNAHFHVPLLEAARGGALLTGVGGDELFAAATIRQASAVARSRVRPGRRDLRHLALDAAPRQLRGWWHRREPVPFAWLTPPARRAAARAFAASEAAEPRGLASRLRHVRSSKPLAVGTASLALLARDAGAEIAHPLLDAAAWAAVRRSAPGGGYPGRDEGMRAIFGALLPAEVLTRRDKATFDEVFFGRHGRALACGWRGAGVPEGLVDPAALRGHWLGPRPRAQSFLLLQAAWLASGSDRGEEPLDALGQRLPALWPPQPPDGD